VSGASVAGNRPKVQQQASHAHLAQDVSRSPAPPLRSRRGHLDAIIVPASRPASFLQPAIELAAFLGAQLVVLCSKQAKIEQVAQRVAKTAGGRALIAQIPNAWAHPQFPSRTSAEKFQRASANRQSDLSAKRNLGLLLARLHGWHKIAFVDDDVTLSQTDNVARLAGQLDQHQVAGMVVRDYPDNSVVCHARRLAGLWQDVFVTGAVLGVNCSSLPLSFFPDIYNEDWFFFAKEAAARRLPRVGQARQVPYDPFASPERARREEFGDLLAEGLYALMDGENPGVSLEKQLRDVKASYWSQFIDARCEVLTETMTRLRQFRDRDGEDGRVTSALASLAVAKSQIAETITEDLCANFVHDWLEDLKDWQRFSNSVNNVSSTREAMSFLRLERWIRAEFGAAEIDSERLPDPAQDSSRPLVSDRNRRSNRPKGRRNWRSPVGSNPSAS
jgi:hypothetical protein